MINSYKVMYIYIFKIKIAIWVINPVIKDHGITKIFTLMGKDKNGEFKIERQFSDFDKLRKLLLVRFAGIFIPTLPSKNIIESLFQSGSKKFTHGTDE